MGPCFLGLLLVGCSGSDTSNANNGGAGTSGAANGGSPSGGANGNGGSGGNSQPATCSNVSPCGGNVVGTWNVTSSCLSLAGGMDVSLASLGCATVPATGSLNVTGTWTANADGTYTDNTTTTGSVTFPLTPACLTISSVPTTCDRVGSIFTALGWASATCTPAASGSGCNCSATANQNGGLGLVSAFASTSGAYSTSGNVLTTDAKLTYSYCVSGNTVTVTPQASSLTGTIVLQKNGTSGTGGATGSGGQPGSGGGPGTGGFVGTGGNVNTGGIVGTGGTRNAGGAAGSGGILGTGGIVSTGGTRNAGGAAGSGGISTTGGRTAAGGSSATTGGVSPTGGRTATGGTVAATGGTVTATGGATSTSSKPCDIYAAASNTCVAAHSTVRALFAAYSGALYQVKRASDSTTKDIPVLSAGGLADSATQDTFCSGTTCTITRVYDQSGHGNFLEAETTDSTVGGHAGETAASATAESLNVSGHKVYSLYIKPSQAYWRDGHTTGIPTGSAPQGIYMVTSGKHYNGGCCFDYGNGETTRTYVAGASMDAINFSNQTTWGTGAGAGPWVMADLEGGLFSGGTAGNNANNPTQTATYVTAVEKNNGTGTFALKGADATAGNLGTYYNGAAPAGKNPMQKQGAIVLGSGGDCCYSNNNASQGTFYEGAIVSGYPSDTTDSAVQANIVSAGYGK